MKIREPGSCPHESVRIVGIVHGRTGARITRTIAGECEKCGARVERMQTVCELRTGIPEEWWEERGLARR